MEIIRVFLRKTNATPDDDFSFILNPYYLFCGFDKLLIPDIFFKSGVKINISVVFTYDLKKAEKLAKKLSQYNKVEIGGPATGMRGEEFVPGKYLKKGYVITSRGCRNRCWFCTVWKREGEVRELPIREGNNILDDNLLACSDRHVQQVFDMLKNQEGKRQFTGGLEAALLKEWHVQELKKIRPYQIFFAYDTPNDKEPLFEAGKLLKKYGFKSQLRSYCLIGYRGDTFQKAEKRLRECYQAGFLPMAMLYVNEEGRRDENWKKFQREWARPAIIRNKLKLRR